MIVPVFSRVSQVRIPPALVRIPDLMNMTDHKTIPSLCPMIPPTMVGDMPIRPSGLASFTRSPITVVFIVAVGFLGTLDDVSS
jgi:hypothetical protein